MDTSSATANLRPLRFSDYIGQKSIIQTLSLFVSAVKKRGGVPSEHILFYGPPGIGKTTLAHVIAREMGGEIKITSGAAVQKGGDLAAILTNLKENDVLFIDEIHRIPKHVEEMLYPVLEEYHLDIIIGKGPSARTVRLPVPKITIIGATTKLALLSAPLRDRFGLVLRLDYYRPEEMNKIVKRSAKLLKLTLTEDAVEEIVVRSRKTPRIANRMLKRARDMAQIHKHEVLDKKVLRDLFVLLDIDSAGLGYLDLKYLTLIADKFQNTPLGVETIASSLSEDKRTIEEFVEPYLLQLGFIKKTSKGRVVTPKGLVHLGIKPKSSRTSQERLV